jgi:hypothetical protein
MLFVYKNLRKDTKVEAFAKEKKAETFSSLPSGLMGGKC